MGQTSNNITKLMDETSIIIAKAWNCWNSSTFFGFLKKNFTDSTICSFLMPPGPTTWPRYKTSNFKKLHFEGFSFRADDCNLFRTYPKSLNANEYLI